MAQALGVRLVDRDGHTLGDGGGELERLERIDVSGLDPRLKECSFAAACDVDNPLCGPRGASAVFGPQKGATLEMVRRLDANLARYAEVLRRDRGVDVADIPGAGAAGGLGAGLVAFLRAELKRGIEIVIDATGLRNHLEGADLVITGEGRMDFQSLGGKTPVGVAGAAAEKGVPVLALVGSIDPGAEAVYQAGISAVAAIVPGPMTLEEAMAGGPELMARAAERAMRIYRMGLESGRPGRW
ncbi:MAG: glycerate kinase, partial [Actinobacteria bacterium]|nr:glycerate kinase [Actinomycetota bacterium]